MPAFGMDVESLRRYKNLQRPAQNLRDYMNDLEFVLTSLAEPDADRAGKRSQATPSGGLNEQTGGRERREEADENVCPTGQRGKDARIGIWRFL